MLEMASELGQATVLWSLNAVDWGPLATPKRIAVRSSAHERATSDSCMMTRTGTAHPWEFAAALLAVLKSYATRHLQIGALRLTGR